MYICTYLHITSFVTEMSELWAVPTLCILWHLHRHECSVMSIILPKNGTQSNNVEICYQIGVVRLSQFLQTNHLTKTYQLCLCSINHRLCIVATVVVCMMIFKFFIVHHFSTLYIVIVIWSSSQSHYIICSNFTTNYWVIECVIGFSHYFLLSW